MKPSQGAAAILVYWTADEVPAPHMSRPEIMTKKQGLTDFFLLAAVKQTLQLQRAFGFVSVETTPRGLTLPSPASHRLLLLRIARRSIKINFTARSSKFLPSSFDDSVHESAFMEQDRYEKVYGMGRQRCFWHLRLCAGAGPDVPWGKLRLVHNTVT